jgi:hypothetical protein
MASQIVWSDPKGPQRQPQKAKVKENDWGIKLNISDIILTQIISQWLFEAIGRSLVTTWNHYESFQRAIQG